MDEKKNILLQLNTFKNLNKFSDSAWYKRGLNPSDNDICERLERLFNKSADSLIEAINSDYSTKQLKNVLENNLKNFKRSDYDTEECEFICDYFFQLSEIVSVDFKDNLNGWLYGRILSTLLRITAFIKRDDRIIETLSQNCTKCHTELKTYIIKKEEGIPDYSWEIIQCINCNEYNLLSTGANVKEARFENYKIVEQLPKAEFTMEQAELRLKQIKYFRNI